MRRPSILPTAAAVAWLVAGALWGQAPSRPPESYAGKPLEQALLDLQARGLKIVFTSNVVLTEMTVKTEPQARDLRGLLEELLAPHGLVAIEGPNETVVVVRSASEGTDVESSGAVQGVVRSLTGRALPGATVRVAESQHETRTDAAGRFVLEDLQPGTVRIEARLPGFVTERLDSLVVRRGETAEIALVLEPTPVIEDELVVTPSRLSLLRDEPMSQVGLTREEILALPHLGEDFFRALTLLPGTLANDVTAQFHVRGGRRDETQILIDGQELYDAYHLKEKDNAVSLVATGTLSSADLTTGGFSAEYGDRMSGVLDMTTVTPTGDPEYRAGLGILSAHVGGGGRFSKDRASWLVEIRRGATDLVGRLLGDEDPVYWDAFAKLDYQLGERSSLRGNALSSGDKLDFGETVDGELKQFLTEYDSNYFWVTHQQILGPLLFVDTAVSTASISRDRQALELEDDARFSIVDRRDLDVLGLRQDWQLQAAPEHRVTWGWRLRDFDTVYDYLSTRDFDNPLAQIRHDSPMGETEFRRTFEEDQQSAYLTDRFQITDRLTAEIGARYDRHTQTDESHLTPRLNLAYAADPHNVLRLAWGRYHQSQRPYEIQVEDGETGFHPVERSEHRVLGFEHLFGASEGNRPTTLRVELYQRRVRNPRTRYENLYEPINSFPEVEPDRVQVAADRALAEGVEIFARGTAGQRIAWWANYTYSKTEDLVDGVWQPRLFDQTHSLNLDFDYRISEFWRINLAWRFHTGWPTTPLAVGTGLDDDGEVEFVPVLGAINSARLSDYHRLDLRASRQWRVRSSVLNFYLDVQNAYSRRNAAGFDIVIDGDDGSTVRTLETWPGFLPSAGITIEF